MFSLYQTAQYLSSAEVVRLSILAGERRGKFRERKK